MNKFEGGQLEQGFRFKEAKPFLREYEDVINRIKKELSQRMIIKESENDS